MLTPVLRHRRKRFYCLVVQHDVAHNCVKGIDGCNIDVMSCADHLSVEFKKIPLPSWCYCAHIGIESCQLLVDHHFLLLDWKKIAVICDRDHKNTYFYGVSHMRHKVCFLKCIVLCFNKVAFVWIWMCGSRITYSSLCFSFVFCSKWRQKGKKINLWHDVAWTLI